MSIINQALRDLDARKTPSAPVQHLLAGTASPSRQKQSILIAGGVLIALLAGLIGWFMRSPESVTPTSTVVPLVKQEAARSVGSVPVEVPELVPIAVPSPPVPSAVPLQALQTSPHPGKLLKPDRPAVALSPVKSAGERLIQPLSLKIADVAMRSPEIRKEINKPSADEEADERYRKAVALIQKGRENQARPLLEESISLSPGHVAARQMLATLLNESGNNREAEAVLREGRAQNPEVVWFSLNLARLLATRGDLEGAAAILQSGLNGRGVNAEYHATLAALSGRLKQHAEAAHQYELALKQQPAQATWWMGLGLAMAAQGKTEDARAAYSRALAVGALPENLEGFVRARLAE